MRVTVLGSSASYAGPGRACAGYLVQAGEASVLVDCGNGVLANLGRIIDPVTLDAVFVTHRHPDHFLDLYSLQAALRYAPEGPAPPLELHLPPGLADRMTCVHGSHAASEMRAAFSTREMEECRVVEFDAGRGGGNDGNGPLRFEPRPMEHADPTFGLRVTRGDASLFYTADTAYAEAVVEAARGVDVLVAEATLVERYAGKAPHLTPGQAAALAHEAGVGRLVLTHLWPTFDRDEILAEARGGPFEGPIDLAEEMMTIEIGDPDDDRQDDHQDDHQEDA